MGNRKLPKDHDTSTFVLQKDLLGGLVEEAWEKASGRQGDQFIATAIF